MIRRILLVATLMISTISWAQVQTLIDKVNFDSNTILVGMASDYNTDKSFEKYNFYIDNASKIDGIKLNLEHGYELNNKVTDENHFMIYAIKDRKIVDQWLVNPKLYNVFHNGIAYSFDADKLEKIAELYSFKYEIVKEEYKNQKEYAKAQKIKQKDYSIFLAYEPEFLVDGSFEVSFKKDDKFKSATDAEEYLLNLIKLITKKKVFVTYAFNEKNLRDQSQITMVVAGPEEVYKKIKLDNLEKGEWTPEIHEAIYVKKK